MSQALKEWAIETNPALLDDLLGLDPEYETWADNYDIETRKLMNINDIYSSDSNLLKAADLKGKAVKLIITGMHTKDFDEKSQDGRAYTAKKLVLEFEGTEKQLVTNKTNAMAISSMYGDDTDAWVGKELKLYSAMVDFGGNQVPAIRVQIEMPETSFDDDIPF